ncbi:hypothetical protein ABZ825_40720 [Streptomyces tauricus]|uniref:hypothetical protein n=1 Tax=Streptomyces tauricus TaxID=68274 RepID=UPI00340DCC28
MSRVRGWEAAMVSWLEEVDRREAAARDRITELRGQIAEVTGQPAEQEAVVSRLEITRETMTEILSGYGPITGADGETEPEGEAVALEEPAAQADRFEAGSPVGVRLVPLWTDQLGVEALPDAYADIVEVLADTVHPMRAHQLCSVLGLSTDKSKVEGFRLKLFFTQLICDLSGPAALVLPHQDVEETAAARGRELARLPLQAHLDLRARHEEAELTALDPYARAALAGGRTRLERGRHRELATSVATVRVTRCVLRSPGQANCYPADTALGLPHERHSLGVRKLAVLEAVRGSYDTAMEAITRCCGKVVGERQVEHLVQAEAVDVAAFHAARIPTPQSADVLLVLSVDGKGIIMRPGHLREATRKAAERAKRTFRTRLAVGEKAGRKRMATLAAVHDADPAVRRPHDIIATPGGRSTARIPHPGPKAQAKWLTGSVEHDPEHVIAAAFDQAQARDPQHRRCWVVLVDVARHQLDLIQAEAERRGVNIHIVLDLVHVVEKLWAASRCFHAPADPAAEDWIADKAAHVLRGCGRQAADEIRADRLGRRWSAARARRAGHPQSEPSQQHLHLAGASRPCAVSDHNGPGMPWAKER